MAQYTNPNQQGGGDNKSFMVMMLALLGVLLGMQFITAKKKAAEPKQPTAVTQSASASNPTEGSPSANSDQNASTVVQQSAPAAAPVKTSVPVVEAKAASTTVIENELYRITFSNKGGQVTSWILKKKPAGGGIFEDNDGKPLNLVHEQAAAKFGYPLSLHTSDASLNTTLANAMYVPSATGNLAAPATLTFKYSNGDLQVVKTFSFDESYVLHSDVAVTRNGQPVRAYIMWPGGFGDQYDSYGYASAQIDTSIDGKTDHTAAKKVGNDATISGPISWGGTSDSFFAAVFLPDSPDSSVLTTTKNELDVSKTIKKSSFSVSKGPVMVPMAGAGLADTSGHTLTRIFVGPKAIRVLKAIHASNNGPNLESLLDFGFFGVIGKYLFIVLQYIHSHMASNWGWAIVLLTIFINILILPFRISTMKNGLKMQRIQPQMNDIKAKYKKYKATDPRRNEMNAEIMKLQKDNGVNMFGGCIPTLITLPLLYAFYGMLPRVVELRHAHFLWMTDLQAPDPLHILPIIMVVSQFLVQFYTPSPGVDASQQKMMAFVMPAISGWFTWYYGAGLAIYWAVGNFIGIIQQAVMNQTSLGKEMRAVAQKRSRRKAGLGAGTTIQGRR
ncbi:membrane protein insertase YidC [Edaphobacter acidisoli]|uniref:Membrane protein insertase YidC n=1 Tax=Edaphobacter acidisoli TaxID=2040573 RepID=A0A916RV17_9BACT|nr:membrane protein insertase YidC [Edaphobacter acidisoli]GGA71794.1 membrane protein insertase YidC [Edaphobacter acidisoli]